MKSVTLKSYGKINIFLHILGKRPDGFHELYTLFSRIGLFDTLTIYPSNEQIIICNKEHIPTDDSNIINQVHNILRDKYCIKQNFTIELTKNIPDGGGLGGGSSNAAAYLNGVLRLIDFDMPMESKLEIMASVGSDTAFFLHDEPMLGRGRGELLSPYGKLPECRIVLINPRVHVPTGKIFTSGNLKLTKVEEVNRMRTISDYGEYGAILYNGMEEAVFGLYPVVKEAKDALTDAGADFALMSGSGATVYGIFKDGETAAFAAGEINKKHPEWDVIITELI